MLRYNETVSPSIRRFGLGKLNKTGKAYERYFQGYIVVSVPRKYAKGCRYEYIYAGEFYRHAVSDRGYWFSKFVCATLYLIAALLFVSAVVEYTRANVTWYVTLPQAIFTAIMGWLALPVGRILMSKRLLTEREYRKSILAVIRVSRWGTYTLASEVLMIFVYVFLHWGDVVSAELIAIAKYVCAAVLLEILRSWLVRAKYEQLENHVEIPEGAVYIKRVGEDSLSVGKEIPAAAEDSI